MVTFTGALPDAEIALFLPREACSSPCSRSDAVDTMKIENANVSILLCAAMMLQCLTSFSACFNDLS